MKRVIAFADFFFWARKKTLEVFRWKKKKNRERERERETLAGSERWCFKHRAFSRFVIVRTLSSLSSPIPLSSLSLSLLLALSRRKENPLKRFTFLLQRKKKYSPRWHERIIHASAVRPGRLRVHVVVEIETLLARRFHAGHSRRHLFGIFFYL